MKKLFLTLGLLILFIAEILRVYFIMPFPGSQHNNTIALAYFLAKYIWWIRIVAIALIAGPLINIFRNGKSAAKIRLSVLLGIYMVIFYFINFRFEADKMFYQPKNKLFLSASVDTTSKNRLIIGVQINGEAKAYPIQVIGYHHQVRDSIGNTPVMITYCTVCRTGRVFSPTVNGKLETFRLVGMDHFNAMFEDATTKSWWQQATGIAIAGPLKGNAMPEIPSRQMTLASWLRLYPDSKVMQPDSSFTKKYAKLINYDNGTIGDDLERRDSGSWKPKSWIIGVVNGHQSKAYDWNELVKKSIIEDSIAGLPLVIFLEKDTSSFHVYNRMVNNLVLHFNSRVDNNLIKDETTQSIWNMDAVCIEGALKGQHLLPVQAYNEFWHSWNSFHPMTEKYTSK